MKRSLAVLLAALVATAAVNVPESGYLLTAPKMLQAGTAERACISLFNLAGPGRQLKLTFNNIDSDLHDNVNNTDFVLFSKWTNIPDYVDANGEHCFDIEVPSKVTVRSARLIMELISTTSLNEYGDTQLNATSEVTLKPETLLTLVQTDKAKYQPGQKVLFRVISLSHDLTALDNDLSEVWITTPDGVRVAQWRDVKTNTGMVQLEMKLTEEPPLGRWTIHVKTPLDIVPKGFLVEEYVLPTFEVKIEAPSSIEGNEKTVTAKVCATYTFGKPLIGANVTINATASIGSWQYNQNPDLVRNLSDYQLSDEKGCVLFDLLVSKIGIGHHDVGGGNTVTLTVVVEEDGTGLQQVETKRVSQKYSSIRLQEGDNSQMFLKPTLPYYGQYTLKRDEKPSANEIVKVCYTATYKDRVTSSSDKPKPVPKDVLYKAASKYSEHIETEFGYTPFFWETESPNRRTTSGECREYRTDEQGSIVYYIPPQAEDVDAVHITTSTQVGGDSDSSHTTLKAFFSPSRSYLSIDAHLLPQLLPCSGDVTVQLLTSQQGPLPPMVYKILSRGRITETTVVTGQVTPASLTFPMEPKMGPEIKLLVYYVMESGEVVSDSRVFMVEKCFPNQVEVSWDQETVKPGDSASFTIRAAPNSVCGVSAVDKSTELLGTSNQITLDTVFNKLRQFVISRNDNPHQVDSDDKYCKLLQRSLVRSLRSGGATPSELPDPPVTSDGSADGGSVQSRRWVGPDPTYRTDRDDAIKPFDEAGFLVLSNLGLETRPCYKRVQAEELPEDILRPLFYPRIVSAALDESMPLPFSVGYASSSSAASGGQSVSSAASTPREEQVRDFFPEAFLFSIVTVDADGVKVLTSEMPDTITSWVGSAVCTNSKDGFGLSNKTSITTFKPFFTKVSLPYSVKRGEVLNMSASVFNFLDSSLSVYLELATSEQYSLAEPQSAAGFDLCIAAGITEVSYFPLTFSSLGEVNITVSVRVKDGNCDQPNTVSPGSDTVIRPIFIKPEGFPQEVTRSRFICVDKGDENNVETVSLPVPEGLVLDSERAYFSVIGDLLGPTYQNLDSGLIQSPTGGGEPNMVTFVPNIYIRSYLEETGQLTERQRRQTEDNMKSGYQRQLRYRRWNGSFSAYGNDDPSGSLWLTAFVTKAFHDASKFIDIDSSIISGSKAWILDQTNKSEGCFPRTGDLIHKELKGGTERGGEAALTAFVMLALKDVASSDQLAGGFACLDDGLLLPNKTLYSEILIAHTFLKMGHDVKGESMVVKLLEKAKREGDDILFWEGDRTSIFGGSKAVDVEMTSYMVLSLLHISGKGYLEEAARAVRWINTQRNSNGGFVSTQDTIVAIKALTEFASRTFSSELTTVVSVTAGGPPAQLTVDATNRLLLQQEKIPDLTLPASVTFDVSPPGCAVVQSIFRYSSTLQVPDPAFSLGVTAKPRGRSGSSYEMEVCTSYIRSAGPADRVILEVEMPSGYIPVDSTLRSLRQSKAVRKYSMSEGKVTFTLQTVTEDKTCLEFRIIQENEVDKLKPSVVKAYNFYRPEERNIKEYELAATAAA